jgi:pyridoxamine 5'-phosphate oxidase
MSIDIDIRNIRRDYNLAELNENNLRNDPLELFEIWLQEALEKEIKEGKFLFFTNYNSNKAKEIEKNSNVSLTFFWEELQRQVRIEGIAQKSSEEVSVEYFSMRARDSQIAAWVSEQSSPMSKEDIEKRLVYFREKFENNLIPKPPHWGAYEVTPVAIEFWQGGPNRLHNRFLYKFVENSWKTQRLGP